METLPFNYLDSLEHFGKNYFTVGKNIYAKNGTWKKESSFKTALRIASWATLALPVIALFSRGTSSLIRAFRTDKALQTRLNYWEKIVQQDVTYDRDKRYKNVLVQAFAHSDLPASAYHRIFMVMCWDSISDFAFGSDGRHREPSPSPEGKRDLILYIPDPDHGRHRAKERLKDDKGNGFSSYLELVFQAQNISKEKFRGFSLTSSQFRFPKYSGLPPRTIQGLFKKCLCSPNL